MPGRVLAPFRDENDGRFTSPKNPAAKKVYSHEYILILRKSGTARDRLMANEQQERQGVTFTEFVKPESK